MFRMVRMLLIWLLAFALPAQGVMATTMVFCGPNHHDRAFVAAVMHDADAAHVGHDLAAHSHHEAADGSTENSAPDVTVTPDKLAPSDMQKCSVCASCCSAAAIHDTVPKLPVLEPVAADFAPVAPVVEPFAADGPERPPRHVLA
jgi:hypothetical protein